MYTASFKLMPVNGGIVLLFMYKAVTMGLSSVLFTAAHCRLLFDESLYLTPIVFIIFFTSCFAPLYIKLMLSSFSAAAYCVFVLTNIVYKRSAISLNTGPATSAP